ncbi:hypothetical protein BH23ACT5_BH23ACT5_23780 [soil metagenome]
MNCDMALAEVMSGNRTEAVEAHLAVCPRCRSNVDSAASMGRHLRDPIIWEEPPDDMEADVIAAVVGEQPVVRGGGCRRGLGLVRQC